MLHKAVDGGLWEHGPGMNGPVLEGPYSINNSYSYFIRPGFILIRSAKVTGTLIASWVAHLTTDSFLPHFLACATPLCPCVIIMSATGEKMAQRRIALKIMDMRPTKKLVLARRGRGRDSVIESRPCRREQKD